MDKGIKVEHGDKLGKTIIFARNHKHAIFIKKRFDFLYPEYNPEFACVIDNYDSKAQDLLESFCDDKEECLPQIAISVDMMDTGVDAPRVVNLVFAKKVRSLTKYWQMVGRGTRLCPNLFELGEDKKEFLMIDCTGNFDFFEVNPEGQTAGVPTNLTHLIFQAKVELGYNLRQVPESGAHEAELSQELLDEAYTQVTALDERRFQVQQKLQVVTKFQSKASWDRLSKVDLGEVNNNIAPLILSNTAIDDIDARHFDLMMFRFQLNLIEQAPTDRYAQQLISIAKALEKKANLPIVESRLPVIREILSDEFWDNVSAPSLNKVYAKLYAR